VEHSADTAAEMCTEKAFRPSIQRLPTPPIGDSSGDRNVGIRSSKPNGRMELQSDDKDWSLYLRVREDATMAAWHIACFLAPHPRLPDHLQEES